MQLTSASSFSQRPSSDVLILPFWQEDKKAEPACPMQEFRALYASIDDFNGKEGETLFLYKKGKESRIIMLGLGKKSECGPETLRKAYAAALKACRGKKLRHISAALPAADGPAAFGSCRRDGQELGRVCTPGLMRGGPATCAVATAATT